MPLGDWYGMFLKANNSMKMTNIYLFVRTCAAILLYKLIEIVWERCKQVDTCLFTFFLRSNSATALLECLTLAHNRDTESLHGLTCQAHIHQSPELI